MRRLVLLPLILILAAGFAKAQAPSGYTKLVSVTATTFTDTQMSSGVILNYVVTATNLAGESGPSNILTAVIPNTAVTHSVALTWNASAGATGYNVYREQVVTPAAPVLNVPVVQ